MYYEQFVCEKHLTPTLKSWPLPQLFIFFAQITHLVHASQELHINAIARGARVVSQASDFP